MECGQFWLLNGGSGRSRRACGRGSRPEPDCEASDSACATRESCASVFPGEVTSMLGFGGAIDARCSKAGGASKSSNYPANDRKPRVRNLSILYCFAGASGFAVLSAASNAANVRACGPPGSSVTFAPPESRRCVSRISKSASETTGSRAIS